ncbi:hypothetical protein CEUSTIGMA_g9893.t1 [Chlamydomonas eustigma]|uniref:Fumarylacetoacetase-like C-terminal domain-containing protein n=1 Tax=Chlamydomonas eustigma TaxID=1157962 RepID=A0A250XHH2_9CHLO|nr:hypothetical protein CEUSTIGMA_g9893.t1 [Chlamydomonas eustigma]|eukprot:GAX82466.1 hypothetical protein CEUSTIGMA_g9893.t1 [Chlamydomonas eustigma]
MRRVFTQLTRRICYEARPSVHSFIPNVWCVGRNYAEHIKELGNEPTNGSLPSYPMIFLKSGSSVLSSSERVIPLPSWSKNVHHEVELAIQLGMGLKPKRAAVSLDLTLRDIQETLKRDKHPWSLAKSFKSSTPLGSFFELSDGRGANIDLQDLQLCLEVNGETRQLGHTRDMIFKVDALLEYLKERFPLLPGDVVLTGTPHGVSSLKHGDQILAKVLSRDGDKVLSEGKWEAVQDQRDH